MRAETFGNILLAVSILTAGWQYYENKQYELNYNTFTKLLEYTTATKVRAILVNNNKLKNYFDAGIEVPSNVMLEISKDQSKDGHALREAIVDLVNYNEAICMGRVTNALSRDILDKEIIKIIELDTTVLKHWFPQSEKERKASYPYTSICFK